MGINIISLILRLIDFFLSVEKEFIKSLHSKEHITEEECRNVGESMKWWDAELALAVATKQPDEVQQILCILEECKGKEWSRFTAREVKGLMHISLTMYRSDCQHILSAMQLRQARELHMAKRRRG